MRSSYYSLIAICLLALPFTTAQAQKKTEILWDNYGVPHIYASSSADMYYAFGCISVRFISSTIKRISISFH